jgi:hypothetical protein
MIKDRGQMTKIVKSLIFAALFSLLFFAKAANANTFKAATCNAADVQAAMNSATGNGDIVQIPAGTCTWTKGVTWNAPPNAILEGAGGTSVLGGGDITIITDHICRQSGGNCTSLGNSAAAISISTNASGTFRLYGITIQRGTQDNTCGGMDCYLGYGSLQIFGSTQQLRVDHCHFAFLDGLAFDVNGQIYGVIDHNIIDSRVGTDNGIRIEATHWGGGSNDYGDGSWADATTFGSNRFVFVEDNAFTDGTNNDCIHGGRYVWRHNTHTNGSIQTHPTGGSGRARGCRATEVYQNTFVGTRENFEDYNVFFLSSGTSLIWGNNAGNGYQNLVTLHSMRRNNNTYARGTTPGDWGYCGTSFNGTGSTWDLNSNTSTGYRCMDQPGQGKGDLLIGQFPNAVNSTTGTISWPHQALEPVYEWLNVWSGTGGGNRMAIYEGDAEIANADYYLYTTSFNGSAGVGSGLLASRPATCAAGPGGNTPGVGYWATDTNTLYVCNPTSTWIVYYKPYAYPHPLVLGSSASVAAPTNLAATVQ